LEKLESLRGTDAIPLWSANDFCAGIECAKVSAPGSEHFMNQTNAMQFDLDAVTRQVLTANQLATEVGYCLESGTPEALETAARLLKQTKEVTETTLDRLQRMGGTASYRAPPQPVPNHLQDTQDTRRLLILLAEAQTIAEAIDAERGRIGEASSDGIPLGRSLGFDLAEAISELRLRIQNTTLRGEEMDLHDKGESR
jgi:hypothetical protein